MKRCYIQTTEEKVCEVQVKAKFGKLLEEIQSPQAGEVQAHLNKYLKRSKLTNTIDQYPDNIDTAINKAAIETQTYFNNGQAEGGLFEVDKQLMNLVVLMFFLILENNN